MSCAVVITYAQNLNEVGCLVYTDGLRVRCEGF